MLFLESTNLLVSCGQVRFESIVLSQMHISALQSCQWELSFSLAPGSRMRATRGEGSYRPCGESLAFELSRFTSWQGRFSCLLFREWEPLGRFGFVRLSGALDLIFGDGSLELSCLGKPAGLMCLALPQLSVWLANRRVGAIVPCSPCMWISELQRIQGMSMSSHHLCTL